MISSNRYINSYIPCMAKYFDLLYELIGSDRLLIVNLNVTINIHIAQNQGEVCSSYLTSFNNNSRSVIVGGAVEAV